MAVQDDLHRLGQLDGIYLGWSVQNITDGNAGTPVTSWYKGRVQQANDGSWLFRSISADGAVVGFQLGPISANWASNENPATGTSVTIPISIMMVQPAPGGGGQGIFVPMTVATVYLQQQLPQEMTN
jgi:hypothetical protein